jgi:hypothetical protein
MLSGKRTSMTGGVGALPAPKRRSTYQYNHTTRIFQSYEPYENSTAESTQASQTLSSPQTDNATININQFGRPHLQAYRLDDIDNVRNDELSYPPSARSLLNCTDKATSSVSTETSIPSAATTNCFGMVPFHLLYINPHQLIFVTDYWKLRTIPTIERPIKLSVSNWV